MADHDFLNPLSTKLDAAQVIRRAYDEDENRLRVDAEVTATIGTVDVLIDASSDNIAIKDPDSGNTLSINNDGSINTSTTVTGIMLDQATSSVAIGDGVNLIDINPDGSINATILGGNTTTKLVPAGETENYYSTNVVAAGATVTVLSYTVPVTGVYVQTVYISGTVIAEYRILKNGTPILVYRMSYTEFSAVLELSTTTAFGVKTVPGDVIEVEVTNVGNGGGTYDISLQNLFS